MAHEPTNIFGYRVLPTGEPRARRVGIGVRAPWMLASNDPSFVPMEHSVPRTEDLTPQRRREIANAQIDMFVQEIRRRHPGFNLDADVRERALGIAERMHTGGVDSLVREVMATANASLPSNIDQLDLNARLQGLNITPQEYYAALSRFGAAGYGDIAALIAAYRAAVANGTSGSSYESRVASEGYSGAAAGYLINPDSVNMGNYMSTPYATTGMTHGTFSYLNTYRLPDGGRFTGLNILHAGQDSRRHGFSPNDRPVVRDFATVDHYDGDRRDERNRHLDELRRRAQTDAELQRLQTAYRAATTEEDRRRIAAQIHARGLQVQHDSGYTDFNNRGPVQSRAPGSRIGSAVIGRALGIEARHMPHNGSDAPEVINGTAQHIIDQRWSDQGIRRDAQAVTDADLRRAQRPQDGEQVVADITNMFGTTAIATASNPTRTADLTSATSQPAVLTASLDARPTGQPDQQTGPTSAPSSSPSTARSTTTVASTATRTSAPRATV